MNPILPLALLLGAPLFAGAQTCELVLDININGDDDSNPEGFTRLGPDLVVFRADDGVSGVELYCWSEATGVCFLADINPGHEDGAYPVQPAVLWKAGEPPKMLFVGDNGSYNHEPWITDGTPAGTHMLLDINGSGNSGPSSFVFHPSHGVMFFEAYDPAHGSEIWTTDGTAAGTSMLVDLTPGFESWGSVKNTAPQELTVLGDLLVFSGEVQDDERELYVSDGTAAGTGLLMDLAPGTDGSGKPLEGDPHDLVRFGDLVAFVASDGVSGDELWVTDGTAAGTLMLVDLYPGSSGSYPHELTALGDKLYFNANDGSTGYELYVTDGTPAGTLQVTDYGQPGEGISPYSMTVGGDGLLYFAAKEPTTPGTGTELWTSDGTAAGTAEIMDLTPGKDSSWPGELIAGNGGVYAALNGPNGVGLFHATSTSITELCVQWAGLHNSMPEGLTHVGRSLVYSAKNPLVGFEMFRLIDSGALAIELGPGATDAFLSSHDPILGQPLELSGRVPGGAPGLLLASGHVGQPGATLGLGEGLLWLDPVSTWVVTSLPPSPWTKSLPLPAQPALAGARLNLQGWHPAAVPSGAVFTNGVMLILGL